MDLHRHDFLILVGLVAGGWWHQLSPIKQALAAMAVVAVVAFSAGTLMSQLVIERGGALAKLERVERVSTRDSIRVDSLASLHLGDREIMDRLGDLEQVMGLVDRRTERILCVIRGRPAAECL